MKKLNLNIFELSELILLATGKTQEEVEKTMGNDFDLEEYISYHFETLGYIETMLLIVSNLMEMVFTGKSVDGEWHKGFGLPVESGVRAICRIKLLREKE